MTIATQTHDDFKMFTGKLDDAGHISEVAKQVQTWSEKKTFAPKSIGIEYVEHSKQIILSVGYRTDEDGYAVTLRSQKIGRIGELNADELVRLERAMKAVAQNAQDVICHELYVTEANDLYMVTMSHA